MNLNKVIQEIRARCVEFKNNVGGAAELAVLTEATNLALPSAYVIPTGDDVSDAIQSLQYSQVITERFSVAVVLSNLPDERGQTGANALDDIRASLFKCLIGWAINASADAIEYDGSSLYQMDRARLIWEYRFRYQLEIGLEDSRLATDYNEMPLLESVHTKIDIIDPAADPNHPNTGAYPGPDGRFEHYIVMKGRS